MHLSEASRKVMVTSLESEIKERENMLSRRRSMFLDRKNDLEREGAELREREEAVAAMRQALVELL